MTRYLTIIEKNACASFGRYQKKKYQKRNFRIFGNPNEIYKEIIKNIYHPLHKGGVFFSL